MTALNFADLTFQLVPDFKPFNASTTNQLLWPETETERTHLLIFSIFVSVPPQKPLIMDERGRQVEGEMGIGPFREGDSLTLECHVSGGEFPFLFWTT